MTIRALYRPNDGLEGMNATDFSLVAVIPKFSRFDGNNQPREEANRLFEATVRFLEARGGAFLKEYDYTSDVEHTIMGCSTARSNEMRCDEEFDDDGDTLCACGRLPWQFTVSELAYA